MPILFRLLPEANQLVVGYIWIDCKNLALAGANAAASAYWKNLLTYDWRHLIAGTSTWIWVAASQLAGLIMAWLIQLWITGLQPAWRYWFGIAVWSISAGFITFAFHQLSLAWLGAIVGYVTGQFIGWWAAIGYHETDERHSDMRTVQHQIGAPNTFNPLKYVKAKPGQSATKIFVGLNSKREPEYITLAIARKHCQLLGETRNGKTVSATLLLDQFCKIGETVVILDPKADKHSPAVMKASAERANVPFIYIDLRPDQAPQLDLLAGTSASDIEELLISCFDLGSKGTDADVYRVKDRAAARKLAHSGARTCLQMVQIGLLDETIHNAQKFWEDLQELAAHPAIQTQQGWQLNKLIGTPAVIYIVGSTRHDNTVRLQRLVLLRLLQIIDQYGQAQDANWTALFIDEFKYLLSPAALRAMGTVADRNCHLIIAHQSLGDLRDTNGLDPEAVYGAVVVNTGLKLFYKTNDPDTAKWGSELSGDIPTYTESIAKSPAANNPGVFTERMRPLIEKNVLLSLPPLTGVLFGAGVAKQVSVHYLPKSPEPPAIRPAEPMESTTNCEELI